MTQRLSGSLELAQLKRRVLAPISPAGNLLAYAAHSCIPTVFVPLFESMNRCL